MRETSDGEAGSRLSRRRVLGACGSAAVAAAAGCVNAPTPSNGGTETTGTRTETTVQATLTDYDVALSRTSLPAGEVTFDVENEADQVHEFVVFATDRAEGDLPTTDGGSEVDEDAPGLELVDEVEDVAGGASATLTVDFEPGHYVGICNIPGHYELGMHAGFAVE
ncbi:MAG: twin-arginine translocation signal domain-containing protein [Halobacteriaceae archaeon]